VDYTIEFARVLRGRSPNTLGVRARIADFVCFDREPSASVVEKRQADCDSGAGHLLAIIKPKIVRYTIILSVSTDGANFSKWPAC
jgi:hypothetical protein